MPARIESPVLQPRTAAPAPTDSPDASLAATPEATAAPDAVAVADLKGYTPLRTPSQLNFPSRQPTPAFTPDYRRPETALLAAKYLSDNPETIVQKGSGVLAPERSLPTKGVSRISFYHSFVAPDQKQAYVTVSAADGGKFYLRGQGAAIADPLNASLAANQKYPGHMPEVKIIQADGSERSLNPVPSYQPKTQRYEPAISLEPGERAFISVGTPIKPTTVKDEAALDKAHKASQNTLVGHLDLEPVNGTRLKAGTYVEGHEKLSEHQGIKAKDYARAADAGQNPHNYVQTPVSEKAQPTAYGNYQGDTAKQGTPTTDIKPHHSVFVALDPSGVIPYREADIGKDKQTGVNFVRLIGARDGQARVDDDLDGKFNEDGAEVYPNPDGSRTIHTSNYEATAGYISRKKPGQQVNANEGDKDGYGLPYRLPNQLFATPGAKPKQPQDGDKLNSGQLILRGDPPKYDQQNPPKPGYMSKYAVTIIDADNHTQEILIGARENGTTSTGTPATRNSFWSLDLSQHPCKLPIRIVTHEGSDLGLQVFYEAPGAKLRDRAKPADARLPNSPLALPVMTE